MAHLAIGCVCGAGVAAYVYRSRAYAALKELVRRIATTMFYVGYDALNPTLAAERRRNLFTKYGAREFVCQNIDAVYVPAAQNKTGHVIVICLNTTFQDHPDAHWTSFRDNGADILLWNPTKLGPIAYSDDLSAILRTLRERSPTQKVVVKTYCASSEPGLRAVANQNDPNMHILFDRGHGDVKTFARSFTVVSKLPIVQTVLQEHFDCQGIEKIAQVRGRMLFLSPRGVDQVMDWGKRNFTRELHEKKADYPVVRMQTEDHWSHWSRTTYGEVFKFLAEEGVVKTDWRLEEEALPKSIPPSWFGRKCKPSLTKACI